MVEASLTSGQLFRREEVDGVNSAEGKQTPGRHHRANRPAANAGARGRFV